MALDFTEFERRLSAHEKEIHEFIKKIIPSVWFTDMHRLKLVKELSTRIIRKSSSSLFEPYVAPFPSVQCNSCGWKGIPIQTKLGARYQESGKPYCPECKSEKLKGI